VYIAERFQGRRKNIFEDIDRKGGSTWSQICTACLEVITGIGSRIAEYQNPKPSLAKDVPQEKIEALPKLGQPLKDGMKAPGDLFASTPPPKSRGAGVAQAVGTFAKSHGQSSPPSLSPNARKLIKAAEGVVLTPQQQADLDARGLSGLFKEWAIWFLKTNLGWPFRQVYRRKIAAIVLGSPYGDVGIIVDAIDALTRFAVKSLEEDKYGNVQRDVKSIIRTFTEAVKELEKFKTSLGFHWTDVDKIQESPEVDILLASLKDGLNQLVEAFGDYSEDLRLSQSEMRMAREAATPARPEMQQAGR